MSETISTEEVREKLAKFMGWVLDPGWGLYHYPDGREVLLPSDGVICPVGNMSWKPDKDRNQLALVLEKVAEMGLEQKLFEALWKYKGEMLYSRANMWAIFTASPETICQAILKVAEENKP